MTFNTPCAGELPGRVAMGSVSATIRACRAYKIDNQTDYRKQARKTRIAAAGFDRQAAFANEDGHPEKARIARAEAARLRALADTMEADAANGVRALCVNGK